MLTRTGCSQAPAEGAIAAAGCARTAGWLGTEDSVVVASDAFTCRASVVVPGLRGRDGFSLVMAKTVSKCPVETYE